MLGVRFDNTQPFPGTDFLFDLATDFLHQVISISLVLKHLSVTGFASEHGFSIWVEATANHGVNEHGVAVRAERPNFDRDS